MNQLPEKIYLYRETLGAVTWGPPKEGAVEYIRADLLRPSVEQVLVRCLNTLILRCPEYGELILDCKKALASIPRADSPDHVPESGKMVDSPDQIVNANKKVDEPEKCPECDGVGRFQAGNAHERWEDDCSSCHGTGLKPKEEKV